MPPKPPRLIHLMALAQHRLLKRSDAAFNEALGISTTQLGVLFVLEKNPGAMPREVSEGLGINASAITALIDRMEAAGLVRRERSDADGRVVHIHATAEGIEKASRARPILARINARLTDGFSEREIAAVARFLGAILDRL